MLASRGERTQSSLRLEMRDDGAVAVSNVLIDDLQARGLIHDSTDRTALAERLNGGPVTLYYGCDPTADSLHIGNLLGLLVLRRFADEGHRPLALAGGATGMIGDPSGRSSERNLLDEATLRANVAAIKEQIQRVVPGAQLVDNLDWTAPTSLIDFLRGVGKHVTVNQMVARESVKVRMASEQGISFTEFSYMLLQANDFLHLNNHAQCELQIGGSDQWGNILSGVDLIRRVTSNTAHAFVWPLLTAPDGTKLGKTTGARIWLDQERTSPYQFFQHFMATDDRQVNEFLAKFTLLSLDEIASIVSDHDAAPGARIGQRQLAESVTSLVHGADASAQASAASKVLFGGALADADASALEMLVDEVPTLRVSRERLASGIPLLELMIEAGLVTSRNEARRAVLQGGAYCNDQRVAEEETLSATQLLYGRFALLRRGRKHYALIVEDN